MVSAVSTQQRPPQSVDLEVRKQEVRQAIDGCLEVVAIRTQLALVLREVEGLTMNGICEILHFSRTGLGVALHRGRNRIRNVSKPAG